MHGPPATVRAGALFAILLMAIGCGDETFILRLNPELGATYEFTTSIETTAEQTVAGQESTTTQTMRTVHDMRFQAAADGDSLDGVTTFVSTSVEMSSAVGDETIDSAALDEVSAALDAVFAALAGKSFTTTVAADGRVTRVSGLDDIADIVVAAMDLSEEMKLTARESLRQTLSDASMEGTMSNMFIAHPADEIAVGESWKSAVAVSGIAAATTYTLAAVDDGIATITATGDFRPDPGYTPGDGLPTLVYDELTGSQAGRYRLDVGTGMLLHAATTSDMTGTAQFDTSGLPPEIAAQLGPILTSSGSTVTVDVFKRD